jgi:nucleotide-binding universal stress UspA family protein
MRPAELQLFVLDADPAYGRAVAAALGDEPAGHEERISCTARAITAAAPLLAQAGRIVVLSVAERERTSREGLERFAAALGWGGVSVEAHLLSEGPSGAAETLLDAVREMRADLLVMGGYGHSQFRELVFGGFTRRVLKGADLPVLMAH